ncbi:uncharacterized protein A4U43_UnF11890 [Asparagus officinalis]|uniref:Uncharacterized protein n=1 Tax=Asparagus officinalis TaxID=4686 RepID=A0A1R3L572_ASPOF|nr:uncharacterized protein A4U43_UnF11890 [Asparagus officinalis]
MARLEPWAGRPGLSLLFCSRHEKDATEECAPFVECPARFTGLLPTKHLPAAPAARQAGGALVILTVLSAGPPPIALAISYGSYSSHPLWPALRGQSELSGQPLTLWGL